MDFLDSSASRHSCQRRRHGLHPWLGKTLNAVWQSPHQRERGRRQETLKVREGREGQEAGDPEGKGGERGAAGRGP